MAIIKLDGGYNALPISYKRGNPIPLDTTAVWYDEAELRAYAASGVTAYVGQVLSLVSEVKNDEGEVTGHTSTAYIIADTNGTLEPIGTAPVGDETSVVVAEDGTVSLKGIDGLVFERDVIGEDGQPTGAKEEVKYQPLMTKNGLVWIEPSKTTVEGLATLIGDLTDRVDALEEVVGDAEGGLVKGLADEIKRADDAEKVLAASIKAITDDYVKANDIAGFETKENVKKVADDLAAYKTSNDAELAKKATIDALNELKGRVDAFLTGDGATDALDSLQELIEYINSHDDLELSYILGDIAGLEAEVSEIGAAIGELRNTDDQHETEMARLDEAINYAYQVLGLAEEGSVSVDTIQEQIAAAKQAAITEAVGTAAADATEKANQALADAKADAKQYATKDYVGTIPSDYSAQKDVISYINKKAEETLAAAQGGSSETAASVKQQLDNYKSENLAKFEKLEGIEAGAEVNKIISVDAKTGNTLLGTSEIVTADRKVTIDDSKIAKAIEDAKLAGTNAQNAAEAAQNKANSNESAIGALDGRMGTAEGKINDNIAAIAAHATEYSELKGVVEGHGTAIGNKADTTTVNALTDIVNGHTTSIANLDTNKANAADVYTKAQVYTKAEIGTIADNKTLVDMINEAKQAAITAATYNDSEVRTLIGNNATAITDITKDGGAIAVAVKAEADRAKGIEAGLEGRLAEVETFFAAVETPDATIDTLAEIVKYIESDKSGAAELTASVKKNADDITALTGRVAANETAISTTLPAAIGQALTDAKKYTDDKFAEIVLADIVATEVEGVVTKTAKAGLIAPEVDKFEVDDGKVTKISTDLLAQGSMTLVLNGGNAKG